jgi:hypothetical protein
VIDSRREVASIVRANGGADERDSGAKGAGSRQKQESMFFFEKKNQKTFAPLLPRKDA